MTETTSKEGDDKNKVQVLHSRRSRNRDREPRRARFGSRAPHRLRWFPGSGRCGSVSGLLVRFAGARGPYQGRCWHPGHHPKFETLSA